MDETLTMSTGVVFRLRQPSVWAITEVKRQMTAAAPKPPVVFIEAKDRSEPNESDPVYIAAVEAHNVRELERLLDTVIATGTTVETVPDSVPALDCEDWRDTLEALGIATTDGRLERYAAWVKIIAAPEPSDWQRLCREAVRCAGTTEADVAAAVNAFAVTRQGQPIAGLSVAESINTGIEYEPLLPGLVPLFEEREAAVYSHYTPRDWRELEPEERAFCVAHYRLHHLIEMHQGDAVRAALKQRERRQQSQGR